MNTLHIYSQIMWHDPAYIVGTEEGLIALRNAIDGALARDVGVETSYVNDGEGFSIAIKKVDEVTAEKLAVPYLMAEAKEKDKEAIRPGNLLFETVREHRRNYGEK